MAFTPYEEVVKNGPQAYAAPVAAPQKPKSPSLGDRVASIFKQSGDKVIESTNRGVDKFNAVPVASPQNKMTPGAALGNEFKKTGALLETGLGDAAAVGRAVFAPFEATASKVGEMTGLTKLIQHVASSPELQPAVGNISKWAEQHPDAARNLSDALTVGATAVADLGGAKNILNADVGKTFSQGNQAIAQGVKDAGSAISNKLESRALAKNTEFAQEFTAPKLTPKEAEEAIKTGRATESGILKPSKVIPTKRDELIAESVADVVSPKKTMVKNIEAMHQKMSQLNNGIRNMIADRKIPFNRNQLKKRLLDASEESKLVFASDATAERTYNAVVDEFMKHVEQGDTLGLFDARQTFDNVPAIRKLLETESLGENVRRQIVLDVRRAANEYIAEQLPANNPYRALLTTESRIYEAVGNVAAQNGSNLGMNNIQILTKKYPLMKWIIGATATGVAGGASIGAGSAIIGSTN